MRAILIAGAAFGALALALPESSHANPICSYSGCTIDVFSLTVARDITGNGSGNSESFNTANESVSNQTLQAEVSSNAITAYGGDGATDGGDGGANSGVVRVGGVNTTSGITTVNANTGQLSIVQQSNSLAAVGNVGF
jgi:hypothetical protein